mmetsp:Transcript_120576/g.240086  ORF Transcript_120576/g.240086 Transcript_120576/m.240086 type:complete len:139 (-) Transcript_120576:110-526(-)
MKLPRQRRWLSLLVVYAGALLVVRLGVAGTSTAFLPAPSLQAAPECLQGGVIGVGGVLALLGPVDGAWAVESGFEGYNKGGFKAPPPPPDGAASSGGSVDAATTIGGAGLAAVGALFVIAYLVSQTKRDKDEDAEVFK